MKTALLVILAALVVFAAGGLVISKRTAARNAAQWAAQEAAWQAEKAALESALEAARSRPAPVPLAIPLNPEAAVLTRPAPTEIIARLQTLKGGSPRQLREAVYWLTELAHAGPAALPAIRAFLQQNIDLDLDTTPFTASKGSSNVRVPLDFVLPPSLRFGLFDVLRQIGGPEAEEILAEAMTHTGRGVEVAYLARALQELAPNKYRDQALSVARDLLATATPLNSASPLDRSHRDNLFSVLTLYNDGSFTSGAQAQLVQADGQIDRSALKYLQQALGAQAVPIVAQAYQDPRVSDSAKKEPLARLALAYVGADDQANDLYQRAINDPVINPKDRKNLIEDLNEDGLDFKNLTQRDLPLINNRMRLIEHLAPGAMDQINAAAFKEAYKDLVNMRAKLANNPQ